MGQAAVATGSEGAASAPAEAATATGIVGVRSRSARRLFATARGGATAHDWVFTAQSATPPTPPE